jgi:hypothetical protein
LRLVRQFSKNFRVLAVTQLPESLLGQVSGVEALVGGGTLAQLLRALQTPGKIEALLLCERSYREGRNRPNSGAPAAMPGVVRHGKIARHPKERIRITAPLRVFPR